MQRDNTTIPQYHNSAISIKYIQFQSRKQIFLKIFINTGAVFSRFFKNKFEKVLTIQKVVVSLHYQSQKQTNFFMRFQEFKTNTYNSIAGYTACIEQKENTLRLLLPHQESEKRNINRQLVAYKNRLAELKEEYELLEMGVLPDWAKEGYIN